MCENWFKTIGRDGKLPNINIMPGVSAVTSITSSSAHLSSAAGLSPQLRPGQAVVNTGTRRFWSQSDKRRRQQSGPHHHPEGHERGHWRLSWRLLQPVLLLGDDRRPGVVDVWQPGWPPSARLPTGSGPTSGLTNEGPSWQRDIIKCHGGHRTLAAKHKIGCENVTTSQKTKALSYLWWGRMASNLCPLFSDPSLDNEVSEASETKWGDEVCSDSENSTIMLYRGAKMHFVIGFC